MQREGLDESTDTRPLAGPFPDLKTREIVRVLVTEIAETVQHANWSPGEQFAFAVGMVRSARLIAEQYGDGPVAPYLADVLDRVNRGGIDAVRQLVEAVTGHDPVPANDDEPAAKAAA